MSEQDLEWFYQVFSRFLHVLFQFSCGLDTSDVQLSFCNVLCPCHTSKSCRSVSNDIKYEDEKCSHLRLLHRGILTCEYLHIYYVHVYIYIIYKQTQKHVPYLWPMRTATFATGEWMHFHWDTEFQCRDPKQCAFLPRISPRIQPTSSATHDSHTKE